MSEIEKKTPESTDPILAAIAHHKTLDRTFLDLAARLGCTDPRIDPACEAAEEAAWTMARTRQLWQAPRHCLNTSRSDPSPDSSSLARWPGTRPPSAPWPRRWSG
jgi:hypothetical protein